MSFSASSAANTAAWVVIILLIVAAIGVAYRLGFMGLVLLGGMTCLVCVLAELDRNTPTWGTDVFKAQMARQRSPDQKAAMSEEDRTYVSALRFYRWCGLFLIVVGALGFVTQQWKLGPGAP